MHPAIDLLKHEHDTILKALDVLDVMTHQMEAEQAVDTHDVARLLSALQQFADRCHHGKEETLLFPALHDTTLGTSGGLARLEDEHAQARDGLQRMEKASLPELNIAEFARAAAGYSALLRAHIRAENEQLFPLAERTLTLAQLTRLGEAFADFETTVMAPREHDALHTTIHGLSKRYLA